MLLVRLRVLTTKPTAQPWRCPSLVGDSTNSHFHWHDDYLSFLQNRGIQPKIQNTKNEKLKDNIEAVERSLSASNPVSLFWKGTTKQTFQVLLEDSTIITISLDEYSGSVTKIVVDHFLNEFIPYSRVIVSSTWGSGCILVGLSNRQLVFIQPKKSVYLYEAKKQSDLTSSVYGDATEVIRELTLDESRKLLISNTTKQFNVYQIIADRKGMVLVEADKYVPTSTPKHPSKTKFVKFSTLHNEVIYCIEEKSNEYIEFQVFKFTKRKLKLQNNVKMPYNEGNGIQLKCGDLSPDESLWALGCSDGTVIVYNLTTGGDKIVNPFAVGYVCTISWNKTSSVLLVGYRDGTVVLLDRSLQPISILFDDGSSASLIEFPVLLGHKVKVVSAAWASEGGMGLGPFTGSRAQKHGDSRPKDYECAYENIAIVMHGGPIVIMRVELGAFNKGKLSNSVLINLRLNNFQVQEALEIILSLSSNTEFYLCFSRMVDYLLKVDSFDPQDYLELVFEKCWQTFIEHKSKFLETARNLYIRYVNRLIREERYEAAFKAAVQIDAPEVFMQLRMCSRSAPLIAEAATLRLQNHYNVYNDFNPSLMKKIIDDATETRDDVIDEGLQLEVKGSIEAALDLYQAHGMLDEERRLQSIAPFLPPDDTQN